MEAVRRNYPCSYRWIFSSAKNLNCMHHGIGGAPFIGHTSGRTSRSWEPMAELLNRSIGHPHGTRLVSLEPDAVDDPDDSWHSGSSCSHVPEIPVRPAQTLQFVANGSTRENSMYATVKLSADNSPCRSVHSLTDELLLLSKHGWYWGPITRSEAEEKLIDQSDGAFLVRDSSDDRYLLSLSFRSYGKTLHTRIERCNGLFSFYLQPEHEGHESIVELIQNSMACSQTAVFCYSRARVPGAPSFPVRLMKPVSRFTQVRSLQYLCRFVIRQTTRLDHIQKLPLPNRIKGYIEEGHY